MEESLFWAFVDPSLLHVDKLVAFALIMLYADRDNDRRVKIVEVTAAVENEGTFINYMYSAFLTKYPGNTHKL